MKKTYLTIALIAAVIALPSCGEEKKEEGDKKKEGQEETTQNSPEENDQEEAEEVSIPEMTTELDLEEVGIPMTISVPEGVAIEEGKWSTYVTNGEGFKIEVSDDYITAEEFMNNWNQNDVNKLKNVLVEEENGFVVETEVAGQLEYHFYYTLTDADGMVYGLENAKDGSRYTKSQAMAMYAASKTASLK